VLGVLAFRASRIVWVVLSYGFTGTVGSCSNIAYLNSGPEYEQQSVNDVMYLYQSQVFLVFSSYLLLCASPEPSH